MRGLEGDFSDSNNKISAIRVSESISTQRSPYATIPSLRFVTRVHYDFFLSRSLSFSLHYLHFVHCSSHFFSFSRVTRERDIYIYTHAYTSGGAYGDDETHRGVGGGWKKKFQETRNRRIYDDQNVVIVIVRSDERIVQRCCFAPFTLPPFVLCENSFLRWA